MDPPSTDNRIGLRIWRNCIDLVASAGSRKRCKDAGICSTSHGAQRTCRKNTNGWSHPSPAAVTDVAGLLIGVGKRERRADPLYEPGQCVAPSTSISHSPLRRVGTAPRLGCCRLRLGCCCCRLRRRRPRGRTRSDASSSLQPPASSLDDDPNSAQIRRRLEEKAHRIHGVTLIPGVVRGTVATDQGAEKERPRAGAVGAGPCLPDRRRIS